MKLEGLSPLAPPGSSRSLMGSIIPFNQEIAATST